MTKTNTINIGVEIHKQVKLYCVENNTNIREYVENLISTDLSNKLRLDSQDKSATSVAQNMEVEKELERLLSKL